MPVDAAVSTAFDHKPLKRLPKFGTVWFTVLKHGANKTDGAKSAPDLIRLLHRLSHANQSFAQDLSAQTAAVNQTW